MVRQLHISAPPMTLLALLDHLLNFLAPALCVGLGVTLAARWLLKARGRPWRRQLLVNTGVGMLVLLGGVVLLGHDGKMATYAALVLAVATSQWLMLRG